jgi:hypothetical protein
MFWLKIFNDSSATRIPIDRQGEGIATMFDRN